MKTIFKTAMFAVAVMAAGYGGVKAYNAYSVKESKLVSENIEALSQSGEGGSTPEYTVICGEKEGKCWARDCSPSGKGDDYGYHCHFTGWQQDSCTGVTQSN